MNRNDISCPHCQEMVETGTPFSQDMTCPHCQGIIPPPTDSSNSLPVVPITPPKAQGAKPKARKFSDIKIKKEVRSKEIYSEVIKKGETTSADIDCDGAALYSRPSFESPIVVFLKRHQSVKVGSPLQDAAGNEWIFVQVEFSSHSGYIPAGTALANQRLNATKGTGVRNIIVGGLILAVGLIITLATYASATSHTGGGHYVVAYGAIFCGGIQLVRGLYQFFTCND